MGNFRCIPIILLLTLLLSVDTALANKFTTIGGGVAGAEQDKTAVLTIIGAYTGLFFILLGVLGIVTRKRFEGFIGFLKKGEGYPRNSYLMIGIGCLLSLLFFL